MMGLTYNTFDTRKQIGTPQGIVYYNTIVSYLEKFIERQKAKPQNEVVFFMALDLDKLDLAEDEILEDEDLRLGINMFDIRNVVYSKYNKWKPLFEEKVNSGKPQIFMTILDWQMDLTKVVELATKFNISHAIEQGVDRCNKEYIKVILSFDDDVVVAANFLCYVATNILFVPKEGVPVSIDITSFQTKTKARKQYKNANTFNVWSYAKGVCCYIKNRL